MWFTQSLFFIQKLTTFFLIVKFQIKIQLFAKKPCFTFQHYTAFFFLVVKKSLSTFVHRAFFFSKHFGFNFVKLFSFTKQNNNNKKKITLNFLNRSFNIYRCMKQVFLALLLFFQPKKKKKFQLQYCV